MESFPENFVSMKMYFSQTHKTQKQEHGTMVYICFMDKRMTLNSYFPHGRNIVEEYSINFFVIETKL
jgi:hypothetical protein